jgi:hypothetical protein
MGGENKPKTEPNIVVGRINFDNNKPELKFKNGLTKEILAEMSKRLDTPLEDSPFYTGKRQGKRMKKGEVSEYYIPPNENHEPIKIPNYLVRHIREQMKDEVVNLILQHTPLKKPIKEMLAIAIKNLK